MKMPSWAPRPEATTRAAGVARPSAQGQAMISTASAALNTWPAGLPAVSQPARVSAEHASTAGTNTAQIRSAIRWMPALRPGPARPACGDAVQLVQLGLDPGGA